MWAEAGATGRAGVLARILALTVTVALVATPAHGAAVQLEGAEPGSETQSPFFRALPGERDRFTVSTARTAQFAGSFEFRDLAPTLQARVPCARPQAGLAGCDVHRNYGGAVLGCERVTRMG